MGGLSSGSSDAVLIGNAIHALLDSSVEPGSLRSGTGVAPAVVEELVRLYGPSHAARWRHTTVPVSAQS
jgi:cytochrome P450